MQALRLINLGCELSHSRIASFRPRSLLSNGNEANENPDDRNATMNKIFATLLIGVGLFGAAPVFAGNEADIIQEGGGENYIEAEQRGRDNDFASSQDGTVNTLGLKQRGRNNKAQAHQNGDDNAVFLDQKSRRRK